MKTVLIIVLLVAVVVLLGWVSFRKTSQKATIEIDTDEMKKDTQQAVDKGKEFVKSTREAVRDDGRSAEQHRDTQK